ncbi:hypothetical protein [Falsiroseomonas sp. HW251]|uniref:hypothetical protein n=1 Tax=Falsiroseomonas sp. HW251 TaxID=3390998 RepID=UPI003D3178F3
MTRARKPAPPVVSAAVAQALHDLAKDQLEQDYLGFVSGSTDQDPKAYLQRIAAANAALESLTLLAAVNTPAGEDADTGGEAELATARAAIADENKT